MKARSQSMLSNGESRTPPEGRGPVELGVRGDDDGRAAVPDRNPPNEVVGDKVVDNGSHGAGAALEAAVLPDPPLGQGAAPLHGMQCIAAPKLVLGRGRDIEVAAGNDALGEVVEPLEAFASGDDDLAGGEQMLQGPLGRLPVPHVAPARPPRTRAEAAHPARGSPRAPVPPSSGSVRTRPHQWRSADSRRKRACAA